MVSSCCSYPWVYTLFLSGLACRSYFFILLTRRPSSTHIQPSSYHQTLWSILFAFAILNCILNSSLIMLPVLQCLHNLVLSRAVACPSLPSLCFHRFLRYYKRIRTPITYWSGSRISLIKLTYLLSKEA